MGKIGKRSSIAKMAVAAMAAVALLASQIPFSFAGGSVSSTAGTEESTIASVEVPLDLGHAFVQYDGQVVAAPSTSITVPEGKILTFGVEADTDYTLQSVNMSLDGVQSPLEIREDGRYSIEADYVRPGLGIVLVTSQNEQSSSNSSIGIEDESAFASTGASTPAAKNVYTYEDDTVVVTATLQDAGAIPANATFTVTPVTAGSKDADGNDAYDYGAYMDALNKSVTGNSAHAYTDQNTLLYDVAFVVDGVEVEPASGAVRIEMSFKKGQLTSALGATDSEDVSIIHLPLSRNVRDTVDSTARATSISADDIIVERPESARVELGANQKLDMTIDQLSIIAATTAKDTSSTSVQGNASESNDQDIIVPQGVQDTDAGNPADNVTFVKDGDIITSSDGFAYQIRTINGTTSATLISYTGSQTDVVIPDTVIDPDDQSVTYAVTGVARKIEGNYYVGSGPFAGNTAITSVSVPEGVTYIEYAFENCSSLTGVSLPKTLLSVGLYAFEGCTSLTSVDLPSSVKTISSFAFANCPRLRAITGGSGVDVIESYAFCYHGSVDGTSTWIYDSALESIGDIDLSNVIQIGSYAFCGCTALHFGDDDAVALNRAFVQLGNYAFYYCRNIKSLTIDGLTSSIGKYAFASCTSLENVSIGGLVTSIGEAAFYKCSALDSVSIGPNVETIGSYAFETTDPRTVVIGSSGGCRLSSVGDYAFYDVHVDGYRGSDITIFKPSADGVTFGTGWIDDKDTVVYPSNKISSAADALTLQEAIDYAADHRENSSIAYSEDGRATITISQPVIVSASLSVPKSAANKTANIVLTSEVGKPVSVSQSSSVSGALVRIGSGSTLTLDGELTLDASGYGNSVVNVNSNAHFVLNKGTITGVKGKSGVTCGVLVSNGGGATFEMNGGSIIGNTSSMCSGGVYIGNGDSFVMNGGSISDNVGKLGGGVMLYGQQSSSETDTASFVMNGGSISGNSTVGNKGAVNADNGGGGVFVYQNASFTLNGGVIDGNSTNGMGGGVATQGWSKNGVIYGGSFVMNGGTISNNWADSCGGGVYSYSQNTVEIWAGVISGNTALRWGGGMYTATEPYTVKLGPTVIADNAATYIGGGIWLCPEGMGSDGNYGSATSENGILNPGIGGTMMAVYDNSAASAGDDLALMSYYSNGWYYSQGTNSPYAVGMSQLGGGAVTWYQDGALAKSSSYYDTGRVTGNARYDADNPIAVDEIITNKQAYALKADVNDASRGLAEGAATLFITGNTARQGGGIGGNGDFILPNEGSSDVTVTKSWEGDEGYERPDSVTVDLIATDFAGTQTTIASAVLGDSCGWTYTWKDLSDEFTYSVQETNVADGYKPVTTTSYDEQSNTTLVSIVNEKVEAHVDYGIHLSKYYFGSGSPEFTFTLTAADDNWNARSGDQAVYRVGDEIVDDGSAFHIRVANGAYDENGHADIVFPDVSYYAPGVYRYLVSEDAVDGYATDTAVFRVAVEVSDSLEASVSYEMLYDGVVYAIDESDAAFYNNETVSIDSTGLSAMSFGSGSGGISAELPLAPEGVDIELYKVSREGGEGLEGCTYALWMANAFGADVLVAEATTNADGLMVFEGVVPKEGELYYFKEVAAPAGHKVDPYRSAYFTAVFDYATGEVGFALAEETEDGLHAASDKVK